MNRFSHSLRFVFSAGLFCLLNTPETRAQQVKWDSTYRPDIYPLQVELFRSAEHSKKDIVFLGNSITFWGAWGELLNSQYVKNRGIPGDMTFGVLDRLDEVISGKPAKVFVLIGINDIARKVPDSVILRNCRRIIESLKAGSPHTEIFFQTLLPVNASFKKLKAHYQPGRIKMINEGLKKLAAEERVGLIDLYAAFADAEGNLPPPLTFDGVHLTKQGYDKWVALLRQGHYVK